MDRGCNSDFSQGWKSVEAVDKRILVAPGRYNLFLLLCVILVELPAIMEGHLRVNLFLSCDVVGKIPVPALSILDKLDIILALFSEPTR